MPQVEDRLTPLVKRPIMRGAADGSAGLVIGRDRDIDEGGNMALHSWLATTLVRHYPSTPVQRTGPWRIEAARNEQVSFQVALRLEREEARWVEVVVEGPDGWDLRIRRVGYVPVRHRNPPIALDADDIEGDGLIPGYVPDPLFDETRLWLPPAETHAFWITVCPAGDAAAGEHVIRARILAEGKEVAAHVLPVRLYDVTIRPRQGFHITHWFYVDALIDWYKTQLFDARFWEILPAYLNDIATHGLDTVYVPVFTPPLDGVKRPSQLLWVERTAPDTTRFDWRDVKRYITLARAAGISHLEWCHFFTQWGAAHAIRIYEGQGADETLLWPPETAATSETYRAFLAQYLPELRRFLETEGLLERSFFQVSDEPPGEEHLEQYRRDRELLRELAPWMRTMDAHTEIEFARQGQVDMPIPSIRTALDFVAEGIPCWCYYCCGPRGAYLNRLLDTPLAKIAMHGLLFYRWPFQGFLHWGYNYWYRSQTRELIDPFTVQDGLRWERGWAYGDPFVVYPGPDGPIDSMRWEVFAESLQDYALLQTLGVARMDPRLQALASFCEFPKLPGWRYRLRRELLRSV